MSGILRIARLNQLSRHALLDASLIRSLISTSTFPLPTEEGIPRFVFDLACALTAECRVTVLAPDAPGAPRVEAKGAVDIRRFTYFLPRRQQRLAYGNGMRNNLRSHFVKLQVPTFLLSQARALRQAIRELDIDVVNSHWLVPQGLTSARVLGSRRRVVHVLSVHAADVYLLDRLPYGGELARYVVNRSDHVFADGSDVRDHLDRLLGRPSGARLQPMGVNLRSFAEGGGQPPEHPFEDGYLLFLGRFTEKKGIKYLLRAMPQILEHHPRLGLLLIGYGILEDELRRETRRLGLEDSVRFAGAMQHDAIGAALRAARLVVVPSVVDQNGETDGMPTVVVEAMASGTQVVGTAVDGIPDVIRHSENGWLCREKDPRDLAEKILGALEAKDPRKLLQNARRTAESLDWSLVGARYAAVFRDAHEASKVSGRTHSPL